MSELTTYRCVRTVGTVLTGEALIRAAELRMPGQSAADYQLPPGMTVNAATAQAWDTLLAAHREWHKALDKLPPGDAATKVTRDKWLLHLLYQLGWGRVETVGGGLSVEAGLGETSAPHFPISHRWSYPDAASPSAWVPLHLLGAGVELDAKTASVTARAPQSMLQDYLNREPRALWAILSNGRKLRLLRDASALARQSYVEFDLDEIFNNQLYADFRLLFLTAHVTRFAPRLTDAVKKSAPASDDKEAPEEIELPEARLDNCWLERWRIQAIDVGSRARLKLQHGIAQALELLGNGFLVCPDNLDLREALANTHDADRDLHRALLRIAYRLIILFVVEERGLLQPNGVSDSAKKAYQEYFSTRRLRDLAATHAGSRHTDLWDAHQFVTDALAGEGLPELGLSGLGASLFSRDFLGILSGARLPNHAFLAAIKALSLIEDPITGTPRPVDFLNLDSEEFGGMYEGLLAYSPRYNPEEHAFTLALTAGNERKKSGSYYTPTELIDLVLSEALDPLIDEARQASNAEQVILALTVVDPACGSGHFLVAAARRLASALAEVRTGDNEPSPASVQAATADVIERCIYGVDLNDLALEITKVALWLEAFDANRPFPFLDAHFRVGNALLGTTPALLKKNIPDSAFAALGDDDKNWTSKLKARNKAERKADSAQLAMHFETENLNVETGALHKTAQAADTGTVGTLVELRARADAWRKLEADPELLEAKLIADAWCAAFVQPKPKGGHGSSHGITHATLRTLAESPQNVPDATIKLVRDIARQYRFFHWHLEFPGIFAVGSGDEDPTTGWSGGFSCVVGNPPWETLQLEDKQFFANLGRDDIAQAPDASVRKTMIAKLAMEDEGLYKRYKDTAREAEATTHLVRGGRYPLTGSGKINTYSLFSETARSIVGPMGIAGIITPTGLATGNTNASFFADTLSGNRLIAFYDFENEAKIFPDVTNRVRFAVTAISGVNRKVVRTRFAFVVRHIADVSSKRFELAASEVLLLNPNTGTLPMFQARLDADITIAIHGRFPILIRDEAPDGNPWKISFSQGLFNMASDAGSFKRADQLAEADFNGWSYAQNNTALLPLYEGKMISHYDHRFGTYRNATQAQINKGTLPQVSDEDHDEAEDLEPLARYWVEKSSVDSALCEKWSEEWILGWRDITHARTERSFVPSVIPKSAVGHTLLIAFPDTSHKIWNMHATWSSIIFDYLARQKLSGTHMTYFIVKQIACPPPDTFEAVAPWDEGLSLADWLRPYVLELSYTSKLMKPYALFLGDQGTPFRWLSDRRALLRAELDGAFLHLYKVQRHEAEYILDSFSIVRKYEERDLKEFRTKRLVLEAYDRMAEAIAKGGKGWRSVADPVPGKGPRHSRTKPT